MLTDRAALVAAVLAEPDEDTPRLAFADWFEEQGDEASTARAEFIRTQVERARLDPADRRESELQARELRLLKQYAAAWCGSHFVFKKCRFRRGFIEYVHLHLQHFLHHRRRMFALEPVRDVSLTGWYRAPDDLVRRVAGCAELSHLQTLRIHHQGPHHDPRSNLVLLLESPHLTRLQTLYGTHVAFDDDARRRFEQLPVLRRVEKLVMPTLDSYPHRPRQWLSNGAAATEWNELRSFTLPYYLNIDLLRQFTRMPWWNQLTSLAVVLPWHNPDSLGVLRDRLLPSLRELTLGVGATPADLGDTGPFFADLARTPLRRLRLNSIPIPPAALGDLLDESARCELESLALSSCRLTTDHARVIADSPRAGSLLKLEIVDWQFGADAARVLFASEHLRSVVSLNLAGSQIGSQGVAELAEADGWDRLRSLDLSGVGLDAAGFESLLLSPNVRNLTHLAVAGWGDNPLGLTARAARRLAELPHLVRLRFDGGSCEPGAREMVAENEAIAWQSVTAADDPQDIVTYRARLRPERSPPVDEAFEGGHFAE